MASAKNNEPRGLEGGKMGWETPENRESAIGTPEEPLDARLGGLLRSLR